MVLAVRNAARSVRCVRSPVLLSSSSSTTARSFSLTTRRQGGGGGQQWDPPSGWLWGVKPGEKAEPEGWEWPMYIFCGSLVVTGIALAFRPDTTVSTWALEEARRRLEAEGILADPSPNHAEKKD